MESDVNKKRDIKSENVEKSLQNLAEMQGIAIKRGWKTRLSSFFGIPLSTLSKWITSGNIPDNWRGFAVKEGYSVSKWLHEEINHRVAEQEDSTGHKNETSDLESNGSVGRSLAVSVPLDLEKIFDEYPELKYALMFAQDGKRRELEQMILNWAGDIKKRKTPSEGERRAAE